MAYLLDLTGTNLSNLVDSQHFRGSATVWYFRPVGGSFFTDGLEVRNTVTNQLLQPHIHYRVLDLDNDASMESGKEVARSIVILDTNLSDIKIKRQVIGGHYEAIGSDIDQLITDQDLNRLNSSTWGQVIGKPIAFSPDPHYHLDKEAYGFGHVTYLIDEIKNLIGSQDKHGFGNIYQYIDDLVQEKQNDIINQLNSLQLTVNAGGGARRFAKGQIIMLYVSTHPATLFGYGEWEQITDTLLYGVNLPAELGTKFKIGSGQDYDVTKVYFWWLKDVVDIVVPPPPPMEGIAPSWWIAVSYYSPVSPVNYNPNVIQTNANRIGPPIPGQITPPEEGSGTLISGRLWLQPWLQTKMHSFQCLAVRISVTDNRLIGEIRRFWTHKYNDGPINSTKSPPLNGVNGTSGPSNREFIIYIEDFEQRVVDGKTYTFANLTPDPVVGDKEEIDIYTRPNMLDKPFCVNGYGKNWDDSINNQWITIEVGVANKPGSMGIGSPMTYASTRKYQQLRVYDHYVHGVEYGTTPPTLDTTRLWYYTKEPNYSYYTYWGQNLDNTLVNNNTFPSSLKSMGGNVSYSARGFGINCLLRDIPPNATLVIDFKTDIKYYIYERFDSLGQPAGAILQTIDYSDQIANFIDRLWYWPNGIATYPPDAKKPLQGGTFVNIGDGYTHYLVQRNINEVTRDRLGQYYYGFKNEGNNRLDTIYPGWHQGYSNVKINGVIYIKMGYLPNGLPFSYNNVVWRTVPIQQGVWS